MLPLPTDNDWWKALPDMLQAQVMVALNTRARKKKGREPVEELLWAGTPHLRTRIILFLFFVWTVLLVVPTPFLVELIDHGGWCALGWAAVSVFIFVPKVTRGSREVFVLTSSRAFASIRSMYCAIETVQLDFSDVTAAKVTINADHTGTIELRSSLPEAGKHPHDLYHRDRVVVFDRVRDLRDACRVLNDLLPREIVDSAGIVS